MSSAMAEAVNQATVLRYSLALSSSNRRDLISATICRTTAKTNTAVEIRDRTVQLPVDSKPQKRRKVSEKPKSTVIAVMMPAR